MQFIFQGVHKDSGIISVEGNSASGSARTNRSQDAALSGERQNTLKRVNGEDEEHGR
jgi:hypothetical protein